jgi:hypothetical protein
MASNGPGGLGQLGAWAARRSEPRLWVSIAAAGCLLAVLGILAISGDAQFDEGGDPGPTAPGIILCLLVVAAGYLLMYWFREAPAASAGVTAVVLALPPLVYFLTFDENDLPPFSIEAVLGLSALVWLISYVVGPSRGRPLLLGAGLVFAWLFALQVIEDPLASGFDNAPLISDDPLGSESPFDVGPGDEGFGDEGFGDEGFGDEGFGDEGFDGGGIESDPVGRGGPSWTTLGVVSVLFGAGCLVAARLLDRRGYAGTATPFVPAGHLALVVGIVFLADALNAVGTGLAFVVAGGLVAWFGALSGRRATTVVGAAEVIVGVNTIVSDVMEDSSATSVGITLFVLGAATVAGAHLLHMATGEPPQTTPGPSSFGGRPGPGAGGGVPPAPTGGFVPPVAPPPMPDRPPLVPGPPFAPPPPPPRPAPPVPPGGTSF